MTLTIQADQPWALGTESLPPVEEASSMPGVVLIEILADEPEWPEDWRDFKDEHHGPINRTADQAAVDDAIRMGFVDGAVFPSVGVSEIPYTVESTDSGPRLRARSAARSNVEDLDPGIVAGAVAHNGLDFVSLRSPAGALRYRMVRRPEKKRPRVYLVEYYRITTFPLEFGPGRVLKTFTLLPGEKTTIRVNSYRASEARRESSTSIIDSFEQSSADHFEESLRLEQDDQFEYGETFSYFAEAEAKGSWGFGSAKAKGGLAGGTEMARRQALHRISGGLQRHVNERSSQREVEINTSFEQSLVEREERSVERVVENVNVSRTLSFVFRQVNQRFLAITHLVDVKVGFFDGSSGSRYEKPLEEHHDVLRYALRTADDPREYKRFDYAVTRDGFKKILDHNAAPLEEDTFIKRVEGSVSVAGVEWDRYRVDYDYRQSHTESESSRSFDVPGVIVAIDRFTLRTEGVVADAILGETDALDTYSTGMRKAEVNRHTADAAEAVARAKMAEALAEREALVNQIVEDADEARATILASLTCERRCEEDE